MPLIRFWRCAVGVAIAATVLAGAGIAAQTGRAGTPGLYVVGGQLVEDGQPFLPRGFNLIGLLAPDWCTVGQGVSARDHFGQAELDAAASWGADTLRFQVSQRGLADATIPQADRDAYLQRVVAGVQLARSNHFTVVLSMQDQSSGCGPAHPLPTDQTVAAWNVLAPAVQDDPYVAFELYNEPNSANTTDGWTQWQRGGDTPNANQGATAVGEQALVDQLRGLGVGNLLIADGLKSAERLSGMPLLHDPAGNLAYGVHPYNFTPGPTWWDQQYGYLTGTVPVVATEWNYTATACGGTAPQLAPTFLRYLHDHGIGLLAHAFDVPGTTITGDWAWTPTQCGTAHGGSGQDTKSYFAAQLDPPPADVDPPTTPGDVQAAATGARRVELSWTASTDDVAVANYRIRRDGVDVGATTNVGFADTSVAPDTTYHYTVQAVDTSGNVSVESDPVPVTTPSASDSTPPTAPDNLHARVVSPSSVTLTWTASSDDVGVAAYRITRDGSYLATTTDLAFTDTGMTSGAAHRYVVNAVDAAGNVSPPSAVATAQVPAPAASGLTGHYFASSTLSNLKLTRLDATVNFAWGTGAPSSALPADRFSVRWTGKIIPLADETYTVYTQSDDGVRVWVNGTRVVNDWSAHPLREDAASVALHANQAYSIKIEYFEQSGSATMKLLWSSRSVRKQVVPASQLLAA